MRRAYYIGPFIPPEWIAAHGLQPCRLQLSATHTGMGIRPGLCPYADALTNHAARPDNALLIVSMTCDQIRRAVESLAQNSAAAGSSVYEFCVPATLHATAREHYRYELERLSRFLVRHGGRKPSGTFLGVTRSHHSEKPTGSARRDGIPVAIVGGHLLREHIELVETIERCGGRVNLDTGEESDRVRPVLPEGSDGERDAVEILTRAYFDMIPDVFRRPDNAFDRWLNLRLKEEKIEGIVFYSYLWCDLWRCKHRQIAADIPLPALHVELGPEVRLQSRTITRIEAFLESLR